MDLSPELRDLLLRNGMQAHINASSNGFQLVVQGHDSPILSYDISEKQLQALTDWGTNFANKKAYNTFTSIVSRDFDMPKDFVHARNANGRVAMGLHGYRIGTGEYGRMGMPGFHHHGWRAVGHFGPVPFLGWTPRQQDGFHLRRIKGQLYFPGAPIVPNRPDGRMKPGELMSGGYGFYYKQQAQTPLPKQDVLQNLQTVITPITAVPRSTVPASPYKDVITSNVYFTNEKWQEVLASHGIIVDTSSKTLTVQSAASPADLQYDLSDDEFNTLTSNDIKAVPVEKRLEELNNVIKDDFAAAVTMNMLNSNQSINIELTQEAKEEINAQLGVSQQQNSLLVQGQNQGQSLSIDIPQEQNSGNQQLPPLAADGVRMDGNDLHLIREDKGFYREGRHGREVTVDEIRVEPVLPDGMAQDKAEGKKEQAPSEMKFRMTAVIDGQVVSHEITQKQYDKFLALDDYHRMKLFAKVFPGVDIKSRGEGSGFGVKLGAALLAGVAVLHELGHTHHHPEPELYMEHHAGLPPRPYFKPGVDTPMDVAARNFEAVVNTEMIHHEVHRGF